MRRDRGAPFRVRVIWRVLRLTSQCINGITGHGFHRSLCGRMYAEHRTWFTGPVDRASMWLYPPDRDHCRRCWLKDRRRL